MILIHNMFKFKLDSMHVFFICQSFFLKLIIVHLGFIAILAFKIISLFLEQNIENRG